MAFIKHAAPGYGTLESHSSILEVVSQGNSGAWVLKLPPRLQAYQTEVESLLGRVFSERQQSDENLELAKQMTINWCASKCRKMGIALEDSYREA